MAFTVIMELVSVVRRAAMSFAVSVLLVVSLKCVIFQCYSSVELIAPNKPHSRGCRHLVFISQLSRLKHCG